MTTEAIAGIADETNTTLESAKDEVQAANSFYDPDLNTEALQRKRMELATTARTKAEDSLTDLQARLQTTAERASKSLETNRPQIASEPAALIQAEQTWNYEIKPMLDAGASLKAIIRESDVVTLLSIERFGKGYLRAAQIKAGNSPENPLELNPDELQTAINNRLALTIPESQRAAFEDSIRAADAAEKMRQIFQEAQQTIHGDVVNNFGAQARARSLAINLRR